MTKQFTVKKIKVALRLIKDAFGYQDYVFLGTYLLIL